MSSPLARLLHYARPQKTTITLATACSLLNKLFDIAPEILIGMAVDVVVNRQASFLAKMGLVDLNSQLYALGAATLLIWFLESLFEYFYSVLWRGLAQTLQHRLRMDAYSHVQRIPLSFFDNQTTGRLMSILNDDINQLERFLDGGANSILQVATSVVLVGAIFFYLSPQVAVLAFLPIPLILLGAFTFQKRLGPRYIEVRERAGQLNARLSNNLSGLVNIKSYVAEEFEIARVERESLAYRQSNQAAIKLSSAFIPIIRMAILAGFLCTLVVGGSLALEGKLAVGSYSVLVFLTQRLLWPLTGLAATTDLFERAMASTVRVLDLLETPAEDMTSGQPLDLKTVKGAVRWIDVDFAYPGRAPLLQGFNLEIPAGSTTALVGATGAGKSTIAKLLLRFHDPTGGRIELDGCDISTIKLGDLRRAVGLVSQEAFLSNDTVAENIGYGQLDLSQLEGRLIEASRVAEAWEFIETLPQGLNTPVGERGQTLSGGQRQRLAIARAVLKDSPVLILDEATSAVDNETEAALARSLNRLCQGRTTLVVAHRLSTIRHADHIVVMDKGRVAERGTHEELVAADGIYAGLWRLQTGESDPRALAGS